MRAVANVWKIPVSLAYFRLVQIELRLARADTDPTALTAENIMHLIAAIKHFFGEATPGAGSTVERVSVIQVNGYIPFSHL